MNYVERAQALRNDPNVHYNCAQSVLIPFAGQMGLTPEQAKALGAHLGSGMRHGATCGVVTGGLMALGAMGYGEAEATQLLREIKQRHGSLDCAALLKASRERGEEKKPHCDGLVLEMVALLEEMTQPRQSETT